MDITIGSDKVLFVSTYSLDYIDEVRRFLSYDGVEMTVVATPYVPPYKVAYYDPKEEKIISKSLEDYRKR